MLTCASRAQEYIKKRDYTGAQALLEFNRKAGDENEVESLLWIGYCAFHLANYQKGANQFGLFRRRGPRNPLRFCIPRSGRGISGGRRARQIKARAALRVEGWRQGGRRRRSGGGDSARGLPPAAVRKNHASRRSHTAPARRAACQVHLYMGCCMYYLQMYEQAEKEATK